jgi:putative transposase
MSSVLWPLQLFDPSAGFAVVERRLPHWTQAGTVCFITFRTADSIPADVLRGWHADRDRWLRTHGIDPAFPDWRDSLRQLDRDLQCEFARTFSDRWHRELDSCSGACVLRRPGLARIVADSLLHFDGARYEMHDFVVMPNHVHLLAAFADERGMLDQCDSWKHFTAREINRSIGVHGRFWQQDGFDHLVRTVKQWESFQRYIAANPAKAGLRPGEFIHFSKSLLSKP